MQVKASQEKIGLDRSEIFAPLVECVANERVKQRAEYAELEPPLRGEQGVVAHSDGSDGAGMDCGERGNATIYFARVPSNC